MITALIQPRFWILEGFLLAINWGLSAQPVLDNYIREGFAKSPILYQDSLSLKKSEIAKEIARSYYLPTSDFQFGYQTSAGGRSIDLPVGDMLNDVYSTLNHLTGSSSFPQIQNQKVNFFPQNFYDAKIRTSVPIYNPEIRHNVDLAGDQIQGAQLEIQLKKRELVTQIKDAYFNYLLATHAVGIYRDALDLANEGQRVNERLLKNGKGLPAYVLRSDAEVESIKAEIYNAEVQVKNAKAWFNFLINHETGDAIDTTFEESAALRKCYELTATSLNTENREEVKILKNASDIYNNVIQVNKSAAQPRLNGILDLGSQSSNWEFNNQSRYFLLGVQLDVPLFSASRTKKKVEQGQLDLKQNESRMDYTERQLNLSAQTAINNLKATLESISAKEKQLEAAATYRRLINKGYAEGVSTFIETIDARSQWMQAQLSYKIEIYKALKAGAEAERELALYPINQ